MNKRVFWTGVTFQSVNLAGLLLLFLTSLDWSFLTAQFLVAVGYILFNIISLVMIVLGIAMRD